MFHMKLGTTVKNPMRRHGTGFKLCTMCGCFYTHLGLSRHWNHCPKRPKQKQK